MSWWKMSWLGNVLVGKILGWEMSEVEKYLKLENVLVGKRPGWEMSWWKNVLVGKRLELENVLVGRSLGWKMSWLEKVWLVNVWLENVWWVNVWLENVLEPYSATTSQKVFNEPPSGRGTQIPILK